MTNRLRQSGVALIAVLLLLVFILTIVGGLFYRHQIHIHKVTRTLVGEQAVLLLLGAESWARSLLLADARSGSVDHLGEYWAQRLPLLPVEGGRISGCLRDMQGLFSLNSLGSYSIKSWEDEVQAGAAGTVTTRRSLFRNLLLQLQLDDSDQRIAALVDWIDQDAWLLTPDSAEDNEYLLLEPAYRAANGPIGDLSELSLVAGFSSDDVARLEPWVNTVPGDVPLNVNTAPVQVLSALSPLISPQAATALAELRPFASVDAFYSALESVAGETRQTLLTRIPPNLLTVSSSWFAMQADVELAGVRLAYHSLLQRDGSNAIRVLSRTVSFLPPLRDENNRPVAINSLCNQLEVHTSS